jgi:hypothetical protein
MSAALEKLNQALDFITDRGYTVTLALATFDENDERPTYRSLSISDDVADAFRGFASNRAAIVVGLREEGDLDLKEYAATYKLSSHQIEYVSSDDDVLGPIIRSIPSPAQIPLIGDLKDFVDRVRFYCLVISHGNMRAVLFRRYNRTKELLRSKNLVMRLMGDRYERISEPTFQFEPDFDAILFRDFLFVLNKSNFQHIFRYYDQLRSVAKRSLETIRKLVPVSNFDAFGKSCMSHLQKLEKLRNISQKPYLQRVTMKDLKRTIADFKLNIQIVQIDGKEKLLFDTKRRWAILNLLDDDYLGSSMTGIKYEANSKRPVI